MDEAGEGARRNGYVTDDDFVRAVKEVRKKQADRNSLV
jgi:hypothetical protein